jgi:tRNA (guanine37-N1)-methyltransferase
MRQACCGVAAAAEKERFMGKGVVGALASAKGDSYHDDWVLGRPSYTRPAEYEGMKVPQVLLSGDHAAVARWRAQEAQRLTRERRPDLWAAYQPRKDAKKAP